MLTLPNGKRTQLLSPLFERQLAYWQEQLYAVPNYLNLATDRPRPAIQSNSGNRHYFTISKSHLLALKTLSQQNHTSLYVSLLAVFKVLLLRYSGQEDFVVGTLNDERNNPKVQHNIGFFNNTLPLRTDLSGNPSFQALLKRVHTVVSGAKQHQDFPLEKLIDALDIERNLSYPSLFQVMFAFNEYEAQHISLPNLTVTRLDLYNETSKFDLSLFYSSPSLLFEWLG